MSNISTEVVREIVQEENCRIEKAMAKLADSMEKMVTAVNDLAIQSHVTEEKFTRVHGRIDDTQDRLGQANQSILTITTDILPPLEAAVAINSFSSAKMWKVAFAIALPMVIGAWAVLERSHNLQADQINVIVDAIRSLGVATQI